MRLSSINKDTLLLLCLLTEGYTSVFRQVMTLRLTPIGCRYSSSYVAYGKVLIQITKMVNLITIVIPIRQRRRITRIVF